MQDRQETIQQIAVDALVPFSKHPFGASTKEINLLAENIAKCGIIQPIVVRPQGDRYEIISGHRRWAAARHIGMVTVPCVVCDYDDDDAVIAMVTANTSQRQRIAGEELAVAINMMMDARKHQGKASDGRTNEWVAAQLGISVNRVKEYVRLASLVHELMHHYAVGAMALSTASVLYDLPECWQQCVARQLTECHVPLRYITAGHIVDLYRADRLTEQDIHDLLIEPPQSSQNRKKQKKEDKVIQLTFSREALAIYVDVDAAPDIVAGRVLHILAHSATYSVTGHATACDPDTLVAPNQL